MVQPIQLSVPSMKCDGCATAIADALKASAFVQVIEVTLENKEVSVSADASSATIIKLLASAGFEAQQITA